MLVRDMLVLNDVDSKIQELLAQLNDLLATRVAITTGTDTSASSTIGSELDGIDLESIDMSLDEPHGLSITGDDA